MSDRIHSPCVAKYVNAIVPRGGGGIKFLAYRRTRRRIGAPMRDASPDQFRRQCRALSHRKKPSETPQRVRCRNVAARYLKCRGWLHPVTVARPPVELKTPDSTRR